MLSDALHYLIHDAYLRGKNGALYPIIGCISKYHRVHSKSIDFKKKYKDRIHQTDFPIEVEPVVASAVELVDALGDMRHNFGWDLMYLKCFIPELDFDKDLNT